ncbi:MAG: DUF3429 domain-containing protein [Parvularcula sp.]
MFKIGRVIDKELQTKAVAYRLGYAGLLPYAFGALLIWVQPPQLPMGMIGSVVQWVLVYGALSLSFLSGSEWGASIRAGSYSRLFISVGCALAAWIAVIPPGTVPGFSLPVPIQYLMLMAAFAGLLAVEVLLGGGPGWYRSLRVKMTVATISLLMLTMLGVLY